ncbi:MAG: hypothetical protein JNM84_27570 [Planctomycetes bacterium]|nr:hypothetical protein [Planctomycetota bacterium]
MRIACLAALLCAAASPATAQVGFDQLHFPAFVNVWHELSSDRAAEQTFAVQTSGQLVAVELYHLYRSSSGLSYDLRFDLVPLLPNGLPSANPIATVLIPPSGVRSGRPLLLDLQAHHIIVEAGQGYAFHLEAPILSTEAGPRYLWAGEDPGTYPRGECWIRTAAGALQRSAEDLCFGTRIERTPGLLLDLSQPEGSRSLDLRQIGGAPGTLYVLALTLDARNAAPNTGTGPWAGLFLDTSELIGQLEVGAPFVGVYDPMGNAHASFPALSIPGYLVGQTLWGVTREFDFSVGFRGASPIEGVRLR